MNIKYKFLDIQQKPNINIKNINTNEFLNKITLGTKKGTLFRIIGRPDALLENDNEEIWLFGTSYNTAYHIILKNNIVSDRYITKDAALTEDEKSYINKQ